MSGWLPVLLAGAALVGVLQHDRRTLARRWQRLLTSRRVDGTDAHRRSVPGGSSSTPGRRPSFAPPLDLPAAGALSVGVLILVLVPWPVAIPIAGAGAVAAAVVVRRLEPRAVRERRQRLVADLPLVLDLLAAACASGAPPARAMEAVARAVDEPWSGDLSRVVARVRLGSPWSDAFGGSALTELAAPTVQAWLDAESWGAAPGVALAQAAEAARDARRRRGEAAARSVAVSIVGPLGACFLPAFVLLGIVPTVLGALGPALP